MSRLAAPCDVELGADPADEFCHAAFRGKHPAQKKQIPDFICDSGEEFALLRSAGQMDLPVTAALQRVTT